MTDAIPSPPTTIDPLDETGGRALVEAWRASGLSGAAYCRMHDLRPQRLHYWRERLGYPIKLLSSKHAPSASASPPTHGFVQVVVDEAPTTTYVEIVVGGAIVRVQRGCDMTLLRSVVGALQGRD